MVHFTKCLRVVEVAYDMYCIKMCLFQFMSLLQRPANMKHTIYSFVFLFVCLELSCGQKLSIFQDDFEILKRVARQDMPQMPEIPQPPEMKRQLDMLQMTKKANMRKRREAKGIGGSLPTRKG